MKKSDSVYIGTSCFAALYSLCYFFIVYFKIKIPRYYPLEHVWSWTNKPGAISQAWYGMAGGAFVAAGIISLVVFCLVRFAGSGKSMLRPMAAKFAGVLTTIIVIAVIAWLGWHEFAVIKK